MKSVREFTFADFILRFSELQNNELDGSTKNMLKAIFDGDNRQKILYGAGFYGEQAMHFYGADRVYAFADINKHGPDYMGKPVINPSVPENLSDKYEIIICVKEYDSIIDYLKSIGITKFRLFYQIIK
jgi:hypothetical protein